MALYVLDDLLRRIELVEGYSSLIWTERFAAYGDFELTIMSTTKNRALLIIDTWLSRDGSTRAMRIETVEDSTDEDGRAILTVTGRSIESLLEDRVAINSWAGLATNKEWVISGIPGDIARWIFSQICLTGILAVQDIIPYATNQTIYAPDTLSEPIESVTLKIPIGTVYESIKAVCDAYDIGFRLVRGPDNTKLYFNVYAGNDRTSAQSSVAAVVFSPDLDNLANVTELNSVALYKNVAYVFAPAGTAVVYAPEVAGTDVASYTRRVLLVKADDVDAQYVTDSGLTLAVILERRGAEALAKSRKVSAFDGEIPQDGKYKYELDYFLGDMIEMRNADGVTKNMRVTEQIFVSDQEGERSYPTLTDVLFITPGSWFAWDYNQVWDEALGYWVDA